MVKMLGFLFTNRYNVSHSEKYDDGVIMAVPRGYYIVAGMTL